MRGAPGERQHPAGQRGGGAGGGSGRGRKEEDGRQPSEHVDASALRRIGDRKKRAGHADSYALARFIKVCRHCAGAFSCVYGPTRTFHLVDGAQLARSSKRLPLFSDASRDERAAIRRRDVRERVDRVHKSTRGKCPISFVCPGMTVPGRRFPGNPPSHAGTRNRVSTACVPSRVVKRPRRKRSSAYKLGQKRRAARAMYLRAIVFDERSCLVSLRFVKAGARSRPIVGHHVVSEKNSEVTQTRRAACEKRRGSAARVPRLYVEARPLGIGLMMRDDVKQSTRRDAGSERGRLRSAVC